MSKTPFALLLLCSFFVLFPLAAASSKQKVYYFEDNQPRPALRTITAGDNNVTRNFVSATLGDDMVLQRDKPAVVWGYTERGGATVIATLCSVDEKKKRTLSKQQTESDRDTGLWRIAFPPQPASLTPHAIEAKASTRERAELRNVLFGDVYLCGGQSNMEFSMPAQTDGDEIVAEAVRDYQHLRVVTIGCYTKSEVPLPDLQKIESTWSPPTNQSMHKDGPFGRFSALCWLFGKEIADGLDNEVPLGLINNNVGGTPIEVWMENGHYYNAMIHPYAVGPMAISGFTWYQGEANTKDQASADKYASDFRDMVASWRRAFRMPDAYFGFVQLSTWCPRNPSGVAQMREAQMKAMGAVGGKIAYATNADHGAGCNIHPPDKRPVGHRLASSALALQYGQDIPWRSPTYSRAAVAVDGAVVIEFLDVSDKGLRVLANPYNNRLEPSEFSCKDHEEGTCAWSSVLVNGRGWVDASLRIRDGNKVVVTPKNKNDLRLGQDETILATSYGWGAVPMMQLYDAGTDLPVLPWNEKVATIAVPQQ